MKKFLLLLISSCAVTNIEKPIEIPTSRSTEPSIDELLATDSNKFPTSPHWGKEYDDIVLATLKKFPVKKLPCEPITTLKGIAKAESGLKKDSVFMEPPPLRYTSEGLFQLSLEDESWAKCGFRTKSDVRHPLRNIYCAVKIMHRNETKYPTLNFYQAQGKYWSVLRRQEFWPGKKQSGWLRVKKDWESHGCKF